MAGRRPAAMRVLIVRLRALGDVIHALPVACAIRDALPGAWIAWLAEEPARPLLADHPAIDRCVSVPRGWARSPAALAALRRALRAERFDVVLDLQGVRASVLASWLAGAPRRLSFIGMLSHQLRHRIRDEDRLRALSRLCARPLGVELVTATRAHIVDRYLEILAPLGVAAPRVRFGLRESPADAADAERAVARMRLAPGGYALLHPGGAPHKLWPADRFAVVARHLAAGWRLPSVVLQGPGEGERQAAEDVVAASDGSARLAPPLTLAQLAALARRARLFLGAESGPLHLAAAVGAPCIGLVGHVAVARFRPYGDGNVAVAGSPIPVEQASRDGRGAAAMAAIDPALVCRACDQLLQPGGRAAMSREP
ncbi:MAG: glycosyltransferase family 9 protein [Deltaproteobacteria bacterium]|nr:glycosyltransferase family 9 protein [Deltaproteobacteria bacterium]